jgi:lipopolysaccharide transport system ATP-binding protein
MKNLAIKAENISKQYRLGEVGTGTLSHDLNRFWYKLRGKEDPYLKIGESNDRSKKGTSDYVWSLKDINFEIEQGDAVGIIGRNGAGKSTLLKLLSKVTKPTTGSFKVNGRIASLLEVGTGFNPEMTGRENIYMNGSILGMRRHEITRKFDEIVDFSGVERYIDTPVKRYSSGMYVRLAFAVAAHLESEILIVDEVLSVGDAEFQKKCLGKMGEVSKGEGRTVLFVSHNMGAVKKLCNTGIFLENGKVLVQGNVHETVNRYLFNDSQNELLMVFTNPKPNITHGIYRVRIMCEKAILHHQEMIKIAIEFNKNIKNCYVGIALLTIDKIKVFTTVHSIEDGVSRLVCEIPPSLLLKGFYSLDVATFRNEEIYDYLNDVCSFQVVDFVNDYKIYGENMGNLKIDCKWY